MMPGHPKGKAYKRQCSKKLGIGRICLLQSAFMVSFAASYLATLLGTKGDLGRSNFRTLLLFSLFLLGPEDFVIQE